MAFTVVLYTRENINHTASELVEANDKRAALIKRFSNYDTTVKIKKIASKNITLTEMKDAHSQYYTEETKDELLLYVDDRSISSLSSSLIENILGQVSVTLESDVDIFYLANSMDSCTTSYLETTIDDNSISHIKFMKAKSPGGLYAVCSTFEKWKTIFEKMEKKNEKNATGKLTSLVTNEIINGGTTYPRIFEPDPSRFTSDEDNFYTYPCRYETKFGVVNVDNENKAFFWLILGVIIVVFSIWIISKLAPKNRAFVIV